MVGNKLATLGRFLIPKLVTRKIAFLADDKSESESECVFFVRPEKDLGCGSGVGADRHACTHQNNERQWKNKRVYVAYVRSSVPGVGLHLSL